MTPFLDTNILVYAQGAGRKAEISRAILAGGAMISVQVLNEFANVSFRKLGRSLGEIDEAIADILLLVDPPLPLTVALNHAARRLAARDRLGMYDALVVATALSAGCEVLYSEDLQNGRSFGRMVIRNPFAE